MDPAAMNAALPIIEPLVMTGINDLIGLIAGLVHKHASVAQVTNPASGTGPVRFADVFVSVMGDLAKAHGAGQLPGAMPDDPTVKIIIQSVVASMKLSGLLNSPTAAIGVSGAGASQTLALSPGQTITITA